VTGAAGAFGAVPAVATAGAGTLERAGGKREEESDGCGAGWELD
jgi:hypothetical protein